MAVYQGGKKLLMFKGNWRPFALYKGSKQFAGAYHKTIKGTGRVAWDSPYIAKIPSVKVLGKGEQEQLTGKNLAGGKVYNIYPDGSMTIVENSDMFSWVISVKEGEVYNFYSKEQGGLMRIAYTMDFPQNFTHLINPPGYVLIKQNTIKAENVPKNSKYMIVCFYRKSTAQATYEECVKGFSITKGNVSPLPIEPYCGGIPAPNPSYPIMPKFVNGKVTDALGNEAVLPELRGLPDGSAQDVYDCQTGKKTINIEKIILDGDSGYWGKEDNLPNEKGTRYIYVINKNIYDSDISKTTKAACSHFQLLNQGRTYTGDMGFTIYNNRIWIYLDGRPFPDFIKWLNEERDKGTPVAVWCAAKESYEETLPAASLQQQHGSGQIIHTGDGLTPEIEVTYFEEFDKDAPQEVK